MADKRVPKKDNRVPELKDLEVVFKKHYDNLIEEYKQESEQ